MLKKKAFTLAELLIVMVIIAILALVVIVSYSSARTQARDSKRISDMANMTSTVRLYYSKYLKYPNANSSCFLQSGGCLSDLTSNNYIQALPKDPKYDSTDSTAARYDYAYTTDTNSTNAILRAKLESTDSMPSNNYTGGGLTITGTEYCKGSTDYCVRMIP